MDFLYSLLNRYKACGVLFLLHRRLRRATDLLLDMVLVLLFQARGTSALRLDDFLAPAIYLVGAIFWTHIKNQKPNQRHLRLHLHLAFMELMEAAALKYLTEEVLLLSTS